MLSPLSYVRLPRRYGAWTLEADPQRIVYRRRKAEWPRYIRRWPWLACPGNWDRAVADYPPFRLQQMQELFVARCPPEETTLYAQMIEELNTYGVTRAPKLRSVEEVRAYFDRLPALYDSMARTGYQRREGEAFQDEKEITVRIGRDGALIKCGEGTHRHALALVLGLPSVPVVVDLVHPDWVRQCMDRFDVAAPEAVRRGLQALSQESATHTGPDTPAGAS